MLIVGNLRAMGVLQTFIIMRITIALRFRVLQLEAQLRCDISW